MQARFARYAVPAVRAAVTSLTNNGTIDFNGYTITLADGSVLK